MRPSVSMCVPVWDPSPGHLRELFGSIAAQGDLVAEVLVGDDGGGGDVDALAREAGVERVDVHRNPTRLGMVENWNATASRAGGDLVMVLGQDDVLRAGLVERLAAELQDHALVACSAGVILIDDAGRRLRAPRRPNQRERIFAPGRTHRLDQADLVRLCLRNGQVYGEPSSVLFRRSAFEAVGGYRPELGHVADIDLVLRMAGEGAVAHVAEPLVERRIHPRMQSRGDQLSGDAAAARVRLHDEWIHHPALTARDRSRARVALASWSLRDGVQATVAGRWAAAADHARIVGRYGLTAPAAWLENVTELVTGRNRDAR